MVYFNHITFIIIFDYRFYTEKQFSEKLVEEQIKFALNKYDADKTGLIGKLILCLIYLLYMIYTCLISQL